jgi:pimeloyl-ACP methyl ester carboxylesterase
MATTATATMSAELMGRQWPGAPGRTFVALHGLGIGSRLVAPLATRLRTHGTVLAPDLPGVGASAHLATTSAQVSIEAHAAVTSRWLDQRDLRDVTLIGVSVGTQVASRVTAADRAGRVSRLVLLSPTVDPRRRTAIEQLVRLPLEQSVNSLCFHRIAMEDKAAAGPRRLWWLLRSALADQPERRLPDVAVPTLVLRGTLDPLVSRAWAERVASLPARGHVEELPGVRHAMSFEDTAEVAPRIVDWLTRTEEP